MSKVIYVVQLGAGQVGSALKAQIVSEHDHVLERTGMDIRYVGLFTSKLGVFNADGLSPDTITHFPDAADKQATLDLEKIPKPFVVIDATSSDKTEPVLREALQRGGAIVLANKRPLAGSQASYTDSMANNDGKVLFEATVGAGLPVIHTIQSMVACGDEIESIEGCFSGTLGFLFSELQAGKLYSEAVKAAMKLGFTEADPREDLSGMDVARKVMILARLTGQQLEPEDVQVVRLYPDEFADLSVADFLTRMPELDAAFAQQVSDAAAEGKVLRYVASVTKSDCTVGVQSVDAASDIGSLKGPDNIVVIRSKYYRDNPLIIKGPGAGPDVTAAGMFANVLQAAGAL